MASGAIVQFRPTVGMNFETVTVTNAIAVGLTASKFKPSGQVAAETAFITVEDGPVRYRYDGTDPTTTIGHKATSGTTLLLRGEQQMSLFKVIATTATNGTLTSTYERE